MRFKYFFVKILIFTFFSLLSSCSSDYNVGDCFKMKVEYLEAKIIVDDIKNGLIFYTYETPMGSGEGKKSMSPEKFKKFLEVGKFSKGCNK